MKTEKEQTNEMRIGKSPLTEEYYCYQKTEDKGNGCFVIKGKKYNVTKSMLNFLDDAYEKGKSEALSGENCVKLIEQGKEIGRKEAIKQVYRELDKLEVEDTISMVQNNLIKSKLGEVAKEQSSGELAKEQETTE